MISKVIEKQKAIKLRKQGFSYGEILKQIPVAKSTLSLWLRSVRLSNKQKQVLTERKLNAAKRGGEVRKINRIQITEKIRACAEKEIGEITDRELWLVGTALYWAEGNKAKDYNVSQGVIFNNSDPVMIKIFLKWLREILKIDENEIKPEIYIHKNSRNNISDAIKYWAEVADMPIEKFQYIYFKNNKINTKRKNIGNNYYGLLRINIKKSTNINRRISGWISGISKYCRVV